MDSHAHFIEQNFNKPYPSIFREVMNFQMMPKASQVLITDGPHKH